MSAKRKEFIVFLLLFIFTATTLSLNFLHTEKGLDSSHSCPACHFQNSTITTFMISFCFLPQLTVLDTLINFDSFHYNQPHLIIPLSRSPPLA